MGRKQINSKHIWELCSLYLYLSGHDATLYEKVNLYALHCFVFLEASVFGLQPSWCKDWQKHIDLIRNLQVICWMKLKQMFTRRSGSLSRCFGSVDRRVKSQSLLGLSDFCEACITSTVGNALHTVISWFVVGEALLAVYTIYRKLLKNWGVPFSFPSVPSTDEPCLKITKAASSRGFSRSSIFRFRFWINSKAAWSCVVRILAVTFNQGLYLAGFTFEPL